MVGKTSTQPLYPSFMSNHPQRSSWASASSDRAALLSQGHPAFLLPSKSLIWSFTCYPRECFPVCCPSFQPGRSLSTAEAWFLFGRLRLEPAQSRFGFCGAGCFSEVCKSAHRARAAVQGPNVPEFTLKWLLARSV